MISPQRFTEIVHSFLTAAVRRANHDDARGITALAAAQEALMARGGATAVRAAVGGGSPDQGSPDRQDGGGPRLPNALARMLALTPGEVRALPQEAVLARAREMRGLPPEAGVPTAGLK